MGYKHRDLSSDIIVSEKRTVFRESKEKYPCKRFRQMEAIEFIILYIFFATHAVLKIREYSWISLSLSWGIFRHLT